MSETLVSVAFGGATVGVIAGWFLTCGGVRINWPALLALLPVRRRCAHSPLDMVRCSRRRWHLGRHMVYAADVANAHYERTPF